MLKTFRGPFSNFTRSIRRIVRIRYSQLRIACLPARRPDQHVHACNHACWITCVRSMFMYAYTSTHAYTTHSLTQYRHTHVTPNVLNNNLFVAKIMRRPRFPYWATSCRFWHTSSVLEARVAHTFLLALTPLKTFSGPHSLPR